MQPLATHLDKFIDAISVSIKDQFFVKLSMGNYAGADAQLKNIYVKAVSIKRVPQLSFTYRYKTKDIVKNHDEVEGLALIVEAMRSDFLVATLFTSKDELQYELLKSGKQVLRKKESAGMPETKTGEHNKEKHRVIKADGQNYLHALQITDQAGQVYQNAQDKFKQINRFVEVLAPLLKGLDDRRIRNVADMGSGKGYLTFGLYDYLHNTLGWSTAVTGVEYRQDLVDLCNVVSGGSGYDALKFVPGTIEGFDAKEIDMLIALHACDTATDDAIFKGIQAGSKLIIVSPCCHKQIRREMEQGKSSNELSVLIHHGIFMERQAEMVTDSIRALILEYAGYKTKVFEFISDAHTPKNVLIIGQKLSCDSTKLQDQTRKRETLKKINALKAYFGIKEHYLESLVLNFKP